MGIHDIRRANLRALADGFNSDSEFAERVERSEGQINQIIGKNPVRNIGDRLARSLEKALGLKKGTLDVSKEEQTVDVATLLEAMKLVDKALIGLDISQKARASTLVFVYEELHRGRTPEDNTILTVARVGQ